MGRDGHPYVVWQAIDYGGHFQARALERIGKYLLLFYVVFNGLHDATFRAQNTESTKIAGKREMDGKK